MVRPVIDAFLQSLSTDRRGARGDFASHAILAPRSGIMVADEP